MFLSLRVAAEAVTFFAPSFAESIAFEVASLIPFLADEVASLRFEAVSFTAFVVVATAF
jgi:hypothetical protein